ncbi:hypothetical protein KY084_10695 [Stakelama sp. CBK3Z-3]|uniref:Uncharacterized protein n=1 Tax=Stakelama flava TaxID=2860338 RepID=A0ABS6XM98_9SPHN|nr:hypothetical protein [Stakelama flava]MBW4331340.1 hypothetical protein [Stakelama flava]
MRWWVLVGSFTAILTLAGLIRLLKLGHGAIDDEAGAMRLAEQLLTGFNASHAICDLGGETAVVFGDDGIAFVRRHGTHFVARRLGNDPPVTRDLTMVSIGHDETMFGPCVLHLATESDARALVAMLRGKN